MTNVLQSVMEPGGTGVSANVDGWQIAGKSGSTNSDKDIWFCGYSPYYTTAVWMGYDYPQEIHGVNATQPIFKRFMTAIHENLVVKSFAEPKLIKDGTKEQATTKSAEETTPAQTESVTRETDDNNQDYTTRANNNTNTSGSSNTQRTTGQQRTTSQPQITRPINSTSQATLSPSQSSAAKNTAPSMAHPGADVDAW